MLYAEINPDYYCVRSGDQGQWDFWCDLSHIENLDDFNVRYVEDPQNVTSDFWRENGILKFKYYELGDWRALTFARADGLLVERYGDIESDAVYISVYNDGGEPVSSVLKIEALKLGLPEAFSAVELISEENYSAEGGNISVGLSPYQCKVVKIN
jgi:hypothetical protein